MAEEKKGRGRNPFEFGGELRAAHLVDREEELALVMRTADNREKLFLIGPRRYGKTSILARAEADLARAGTVVLRYDAEVYERVGFLAAAIMAGAAKQLTGTLEKAGAAVKRLLDRLKPDVSYDLAEQSITIRFTADTGRAGSDLPVLTNVLNAVERLAADSGIPTLVIIDEFQQVVHEGGEIAEKQIRGTVQRHHHVAYVFAGSKTRLLADMTNDPARAFWKLGTRAFLGPVPRDDFTQFLRSGFERAGFRVTDDGIARILEAAEDVPYNVQQLAHVTWELLHAASGPLTAAFVNKALARLVLRESPLYTQLWNSLTRHQKIALKAVIAEQGVNLRSAAVLANVGLASATMTKMLRVLDAKGVIREEETLGSIRYRLEDPFFGVWLSAVQDGGV